MDVKLEIKKEPQGPDSFELKPETTGNCDATNENLLQNGVKEEKEVDMALVKEDITVEELNFPYSDPRMKPGSISSQNIPNIHGAISPGKGSICSGMSHSFISENSNFEKMNNELEIKQEQLDPSTGIYELKSETVEENSCNAAQNAGLKTEVKGQKQFNIALRKEEITIEELALSYIDQGSHKKVKSSYLDASSSSFIIVMLKRKPNTEKQIFTCKFCSGTFANSSSLKEHKLMHESKKKFKHNNCDKSALVNYISVHESKKLPKCEVCGKSFSQACHVRRHLLIHEGKKPHKCEVCGRSFTQASNMKKHFLIHEGKKPHKCEVCDKHFTHMGNMRKHLLIHEGKKPHKCEVCGKSFTQTSYLRTHLLTHLGCKPHKCEVCGKSFTQASSLRKHNLIHEGKKPHKCQVCGKSFYHLSNLRPHLLIHEGRKPHKCEICTRRFTQAYSLRRHLLVHKSKKACKLEVGKKGFIQLNNFEGKHTG